MSSRNSCMGGIVLGVGAAGGVGHALSGGAREVNRANKAEAVPKKQAGLGVMDMRVDLNQNGNLFFDKNGGAPVNVGALGAEKVRYERSAFVSGAEMMAGRVGERIEAKMALPRQPGGGGGDSGERVHKGLRPPAQKPQF